VAAGNYCELGSYRLDDPGQPDRSRYNSARTDPLGQSVAAGFLCVGTRGSSANVSDGDKSNKIPVIETVPPGFLPLSFCIARKRPVILRGMRHAARELPSKGYRVIVPYLRGYGTTLFLASDTFRNGQQSVVALDIIALMDALKIQKAIIAGVDWGARTADIMAVLWPDRCKGLVPVGGYLIGSPAGNKMPLPPKAEFAWWYQYYFATQNGLVGYGKYTHDFAKLIWQQASPKWNFDDATFDRSAASFYNPDHVAITIHNYRWRIGIAEGESKYDDLEKRLAEGPVISIPTITVEGDANGAPHAPPAAYREKFSGKYEHRDLTGGIGHNLPQEAPQAFAQAVASTLNFALQSSF
jgi:pimeloyl-ACP methyl ester carboxylesterase